MKLTIILTLAIVLLAGIANHVCESAEAEPAPAADAEADPSSAAAEDRGRCGPGLKYACFMGGCGCVDEGIYLG